MGHLFSHGKAKPLLKRVATFFDPGNAFISAKRNLIFVCGGTDGDCMRSRFLKFAEKELSNCHIFLAESALEALVSEPGAGCHDLTAIENFIGEIADAIVLFPESPGSCAELGYFSKTPKLAQKSLVISDYNLQGQDSFIALGPIHQIDTKSIYKPSIQLIYGEEADFKHISQRLAKRITRTRKSFLKKAGPLADREYFFVVLELIRIFSAITVDGIEYVVKSIFEHARPQTIKQVVAILVGAHLVSRCGPDKAFYCITSGESALMEFEGIDETDFKLALSDFYRTCAPDIAGIVSGFSK